MNPAAAAYAAQAAARASQRRRGVLPKQAADLGGDNVPIPRLDQPHEAGRTMASQAGVGGPSQQEVLGSAMGPGSIIEPDRGMGGHHHRVAEPVRDPMTGLQPQDMLPSEAQHDPAYRQGAGSAFATSQPELAQKYGVVRGGKHVMPQQLAAANPRGATPHLRGETLRDLETLGELQRQQQEGMPSMPQTEEEATKGIGVAAHSSRAGTPVHEEQGLSDEERAQAREAIKRLDNFDYEKLREVMNRDVLNNPDQQELIESRLKPLSIEELIMENRVSQTVPIITDKFSVTFESMTGEDDMKLKELIMTESKAVEVTDRYLLDKFAFMSIACGVKAINNHPAPAHRNEKGEFDEDKFWRKFNWVTKRNIHMLASIGVNHTWFEMRVRKMFVAKK